MIAGRDSVFVLGTMSPSLLHAASSAISGADARPRSSVIGSHQPREFPLGKPYPVDFNADDFPRRRPLPEKVQQAPTLWCIVSVALTNNKSPTT